MRCYVIVSGILLILSIIDFALAAPVLVQEERRAQANVVHMSRNVKTALWKRVGGELEKVVEGSFKALEKPVESSDVHVSSSSAPPGTEQGPTIVEQSPVPNPASSTPNDANDEWDEPMYTPPSSPTSLTEFGETHSVFSEGTSSDGYQPVSRPLDPGPSNPRPSWTYSNWDSDSDHSVYSEDSDTSNPAPPKKSGQAHGGGGDDDYSLLGLVWKTWAWLRENWALNSLKSGPKVGPNAGGPNPTPLRIGSPTEAAVTEPDDEGVLGPPTSPHVLTDPDFPLEYLLSTDLQPADFKAAIRKAKGKAKVERHISGTARDVGNATAERELQPDR